MGYVRLLRLLAQLRPAILHSHMFHANLLGRLARILCPVPVLISTLHSAAESGRKSRSVFWRDRLYRWTDALADVTVAVSQAVADRHAQAGAVSRSKLRVIPNGVDTTIFRPDPERRVRMRRTLGLEDEFVWLSAGRLMWKKAPATLLEAFAAVRQGVLLVAGDGPLEPELRVYAEERKLAVRFLGNRRDMPELMCAADAYVQASVVEGLPLALLEAAATALPCVATDAGGSREVVIHGRTGLLVAPGDSRALASAMNELAELTESARAAMGRSARAHVLENFEIGAVAARWEALYRERLGPWT
jgi:glycosyltransferase involved in cell wall biosynthesis